MLSKMHRFDTGFNTGFDNFGGPLFSSHPSLNFKTDNNINLDMIEKLSDYVVYAEIPGCKKKDIKLKIKNNILSISVEKEEITEKEENEVIYSERQFGSYTRSFKIPSKIEEENVNAKYENGVLTITLPKSHETGDFCIDIE